MAASASLAGGRVALSAGASLLTNAKAERNAEATLYVGNVDGGVSEAMLEELFVQAGRVRSVSMPKDRVQNTHMGYGFVEMHSPEDAQYAIRILHMCLLNGKPLRVNISQGSLKDRSGGLAEVGANLFVGNLDASVDEKALYDTFLSFGRILGMPHVSRDPETGKSKGFGFVSFDRFESSDAAIAGMHRQYLAGRPVQVEYALKKDGSGERHGSEAERMIAAAGQPPSLAPAPVFFDGGGGAGAAYPPPPPMPAPPIL